MLSVDYLLLDLDLIHRVGFHFCRFESLIQFARFSPMSFFVLRCSLLDTLGDKFCLLFGLTGSLITLDLEFESQTGCPGVCSGCDWLINSRMARTATEAMMTIPPMIVQ